MSFSMAGRGARGPEINVTPLIDVLLTLIIVFMVVVSMDKEQGETAQIPQQDQKQTAEASQSRTVIIQVVWTKEGQPPTVKINQDEVRWEARNTTRGNLSKTRGESGLRARRCRRRFPIRGRRDRRGASRGCAAGGVAHDGSASRGGVTGLLAFRPCGLGF
jgi:biopolymer transport protein ExbD